MKLETIRGAFPHTEHQTYVNHAAVSPVSRPVREALSSYVAQRHGAGPEAPILDVESLRSVVTEAKERVGKLLGAAEERIEFVPNTSAALNVLAQGLDWEQGDRIVVPDGSFPTNVFPYLNLRSQGVKVDFVPTEEGAYSVTDVERALRPETRLVSVSWVHFLSGFRVDLERLGALCEKHGVIFCVDAIQGLGALQLDVDEASIDFLACGGHKWLMAPQGVGLLYCSKELQKQIRPPAGWLHGPVDWENLDDYELVFHEDARCFRGGTQNSLGIVGLNAACRFYLNAGPAECETRILKRSTTLADELEARGFPRYGTNDPEHASGIVTVVPEDPEGLVNHLKDHNVTAAVRNRKVRFSPTYYNDKSDLQAILEAVDSFQ